MEFCANLCFNGKIWLCYSEDLIASKICDFVGRLCDTSYESCTIVIFYCSKILEKILLLDSRIYLKNIENSLPGNFNQT